MKPEMLLPVARQLLSEGQTRGAQATHLSRALAQGQPSSWIEGEQICGEGEASESLFVIFQGSIRVLRNDATGTPRELVVLQTPTLVGHMGMVDGSTRSATCEAVGDVAGLTFGRPVFQTLMDDGSPQGTAFRRLILNHMMKQLTQANIRIGMLIADLEGARVEAHRAESREWRQKMREEASSAQRPSEAERLRRIAGVLDGWDMKMNVSEDMRFVEDEDMRRTRQAREKNQ